MLAATVCDMVAARSLVWETYNSLTIAIICLVLPLRGIFSDKDLSTLRLPPST